MAIVVVEAIPPDEEQALLREWFETTHFDEDSPEDIPPLDEDPGDDPDEVRTQWIDIHSSEVLGFQRGISTAAFLADRLNTHHDPHSGKFASHGGSGGPGIGTDQTSWLNEQDRDLNLPDSERPLAYGDFNDPVSRPLIAIAHRQGFDAKPKQGSVDDVIANGGIEIHRGMIPHDASGTSAESIRDKMLNGAYEPGKGNYGDGYYFSTSPGIAKMYADRPVMHGGYNAKPVKGGVTQRAALPKNAKIIDYDDIEAMRLEWFNKQKGKVHWDTYSTDFKIPEGKISPTLLDVTNDPGHFAALMGFDAIRVPPKNRAGDRRNKKRILKFTGEDSLGDEIVVLNRSALVVD